MHRHAQFVVITLFRKFLFAGAADATPDKREEGEGDRWLFYCCVFLFGVCLYINTTNSDGNDGDLHVAEESVEKLHLPYRRPLSLPQHQLMGLLLTIILMIFTTNVSCAVSLSESDTPLPYNVSPPILSSFILLFYIWRHQTGPLIQ